jgi:ABC-type protease/lipase transport system fused ATPase/permease subunit
VLQRRDGSISLQEDAILVGLTVFCLLLFTLAAVLALFRSRAVVRQSVALMRDPFPAAEQDVQKLLSTPGSDDTEEVILDLLGRVLIARFDADRSVVTNSGIIIGLIFAGLLCGAIAGLLSTL